MFACVLVRKKKEHKKYPTWTQNITIVQPETLLEAAKKEEMKKYVGEWREKERRKSDDPLLSSFCVFHSFARTHSFWRSVECVSAVQQRKTAMISQEISAR